METAVRKRSTSLSGRQLSLSDGNDCLSTRIAERTIPVCGFLVFAVFRMKLSVFRSTCTRRRTRFLMCPRLNCNSRYLSDSRHASLDRPNFRPTVADAEDWRKTQFQPPSPAIVVLAVVVRSFGLCCGIPRTVDLAFHSQRPIQSKTVLRLTHPQRCMMNVNDV